MKNVSILLCDDHALLRDGLRNLLDAEPDFVVVGEAENGEAAVQALKQLSPDVVLMDINMPGQNGIETVKQMVQLQPDLCVIMLTMFAHEEYLMESVRAGARGYLLKDEPIDIVIEAIRKAVKGEAILHHSLMKKIGQQERLFTNSTATIGLSPREEEVLRLLVDGYANKDIAEKLYITPATVKLHISNVYRKLGVKSRSQAITRAVRSGLVTIQRT